MRPISAVKKLLLQFAAVCLTLLLGQTLAAAQATSTASRLGDLQLGIGYTSANADYEYVPNRIAGFTLYGDFDFKEHYGVEFVFHQLKDPDSDVYQHTFEFGGRYIRHYRNNRFSPYFKGSIGRGILNFPLNDANLAYNVLAAAIGTDIELHPRINFRVEYEYQDWLAAPGPGLTLNPSLVTIGIAYHFGPGTPH